MSRNSSYFVGYAKSGRVNVNSQSVVKSLHREVTLDALCILENGEYVNIEMQKRSM